jgi:hypothetical protein
MKAVDLLALTGAHIADIRQERLLQLDPMPSRRDGTNVQPSRAEDLLAERL